MIYSMTGFGKASAQDNELIAEVEVKSLNSRFLDLSVRLPKSQFSNELKIRNLVKDKISRGKVSVNAFVKIDGLGEKFVTINEGALKNCINIVSKIKDEIKDSSPLMVEDILKFQNILFDDSSCEDEREFLLIKKALEEALNKLTEMRAKEGKELEKDLRYRISKIEKYLDEIKSFTNTVVEEYFNKLKDRAKQLLTDLDQYDDRLKVELALLSEKYDITEEIVRLKSHLKAFYGILDKGEDVGRKLNFLCQEMNREANTINSKSISTDISYRAISIKEELEKIREQIQNIE